ncbi:hypothetical protein Q5P01_012436 [Channa striata]|uniref:Uncharacterized protein n=1 Tax=Channa striata TaxID=64152 RepID=A0AA88MRZ1_CHASR|nr:hypothetical protein Q5P01_012436 [Channa striata]
MCSLVPRSSLPELWESAHSEERSTLILFGQAFVWDTSKPKQPGEAPQQGLSRLCSAWCQNVAGCSGAGIYHV